MRTENENCKVMMMGWKSIKRKGLEKVSTRARDEVAKRIKEIFIHFFRNGFRLPFNWEVHESFLSFFDVYQR